MADISVIGAGSWGTALAVLLHKNGHRVTVWSVLKEEIEMLEKEHEHKDKLPGVKLPEDMVLTTDLKSAVEGKDVLVLAVPSPYTRSTAHRMEKFVSEGQIIVDVAKGIEEKTLLTLSQVIGGEIPQAKVAVLSGPSHAEEVGRGIPTTIVVGAKEKETAEYLQNLFMNEAFRVYISPDVLGIELGAALKNVVALAAGIADGFLLLCPHHDSISNCSRRVVYDRIRRRCLTNKVRSFAALVINHPSGTIRKPHLRT